MINYAEESSRVFREKFGQDGDCLCFAPGRVNLIGEHIDYNGGHVFPCALTLGTWGVARKRPDRKLRFYSLNFRGIGVIDVDLDGLVNDQRHHWSNYPKSMIDGFARHGMSVEQGADFLFYGNIPPASGLSSSASVEVLTGVLLRELYGFEVSNLKISLIAQEAENQFIGVNCGIMDQYAIAMGRKGAAMLLDTATLETFYAPLRLEDKVLIIANSNKKRGLGNSAYNERRAQCEEALRDLQAKKTDLKYLCQLKVEEFEELETFIRDKVCRRRARHAVSEEGRTLGAFKALAAADHSLFGRLMQASHVSLRDDYEVSCRELDYLVDYSLAHPACLGSRMTGAGFGGCTVSLVSKNGAESFIEEVGKKYKQSLGYAADFYQAEAGEGATKLSRSTSFFCRNGRKDLRAETPRKFHNRSH